MRPRQSLVELFSAFLQFESDRVQGWIADPRLRRSMERCLSQATDASPQPQQLPQEGEQFWAIYWHQAWQARPDGLGHSHLSAYVQETCYWAAHKIVAGFASSQYSLADCFQMAIAQLDKVLQGFNPQQGYSLKNYASALFNSLMREGLRQRREVDICTDWALLRKLSQKRLVESLRHAGLSTERVEQSVLAWTGFKTCYVPTQASATRQLPKPDGATWEAIAQFYSHERHSQLAAPGLEVDALTLERWLVTCAKAARAYLYPNVMSINAPRSGDDAGEWVDNLPQDGQESLLGDLIAQEEADQQQTRKADMLTVLITALGQLDPQSQTLLQLYYQQTLTQQQIAQQLDMKQYTISRRLTKIRELLLRALAAWSSDVLHITPTSDVLKDISMALDPWLENYYSQSETPSSDLIQVE